MAPGRLHQGTVALGVRSTTAGWQPGVPQTLPGSSFSVTVRFNTSWGEAEGQR